MSRIASIYHKVITEVLNQDCIREISHDSVDPIPLPATVHPADSTVKTSELGFFYPNMPKEWGEGNIVYQDGKCYFRDVYSFTNCMRVIAQSRNFNKVKNTLDICLMGESQLWWSSQLTNVLQARYLATPGVEEYCGALEERF